MAFTFIISLDGRMGLGVALVSYLGWWIVICLTVVFPCRGDAFHVSTEWVAEPKLTHTAVVADDGRGLVSNLKVCPAPADIWETHFYIPLC